MTSQGEAAHVEFVLDGRPVGVPDDGGTLLDALRERLGVNSVKDGCSPQGQCGCCTVWVDGEPRVSCVTPTRRVRGRTVTTVDGLDEADAWATSFCATGASQCGFCTPGIVMRLAAIAPDRRDDESVRRALLAHLCRCTGWNTILDAARTVGTEAQPTRDLRLASRRATLEGRSDQRVDPAVALGRGGFADDEAPARALVAVPDTSGAWHVAETLADARRLAGKVQGRRTTAPLSWPVELPPGEWVRTLRTTWVEPAYLELDASWCRPGEEPYSPLGNGGAFGGKRRSGVGEVARRLADEHGRPVRVLLSREDAVRLGPKRPPVAIGVDADGAGVLRMARPTADRAAVDDLRGAIAAVAPRLEVELVDVVGPSVALDLRGTGWVEAAVVLAALGAAPDEIHSPEGAVAGATIDPVDGSVEIRVRCGRPLDEVVLRSYCLGAAHMALGWVRSEGLAVGDDGTPLDLTIRSFGILRAVDMPEVRITIDDGDGPPVNGSDAVFAAVAAAAWRRAGHPERWPDER